MKRTKVRNLTANTLPEIVEVYQRGNFKEK